MDGAPLTPLPPAPVPSGSGGRSVGISAVERDTGLPKETLRVWERRYGFPKPDRDDQENRRYPPEQIAKLRLIKRLIDLGHRPGRVVELPTEALEQLLARVPGGMTGPVAVQALDQIMVLVLANDLDALASRLERERAQRGLGAFVIDVVAPLVSRVGDAWMRGHLSVFQEHQFSEMLFRLLRQAILGLPPESAQPRPRVTLTTCPFEPHALGLLMAEAVLALEGCACVSCGPSLPLEEIIQAAMANRADVVALSFTPLPTRTQIVDCLRDLRRQLPADIVIWCGGAGILGLVPPPGVVFVPGLGDIPEVVRQWRHAADVIR